MVTIAELREAGASELFIDYYAAAPESASARREVESGPFSLERLNASPTLGGGFFAALWEGDERGAYLRADKHNRSILKNLADAGRIEIPM